MTKRKSRPTGEGRVVGTSAWDRQPGDLASALIWLYNFDINGPDLKDKHKEFLDQNIIPALKANPDARVALFGYASKSGEDLDNVVLSGERASAVKAHLLSKGVSPNQFEPGEAARHGSRLSKSKSKEDWGDRAVALFLSFPVTIHSVRLTTDDGKKVLLWDDIIGLDARDGRWIDKINIEVEALGAPRFWVVDNATRLDIMPLFMTVHPWSRPPGKAMGEGTLPMAPKWEVFMAESGRQPRDPLDRTLYRVSRPIDHAGKFLAVEQGHFPEVASVGRYGHKANNSAIEFRKALGWESRGECIQGAISSSEENQEIPDAQRLLQAGGLEVLQVDVSGKRDRPKTRTQDPISTRALIRSPADVFYYSGNGKKDGSLVDDDDKLWATPKDLQQYWKVPLDMEALILAAPWVLHISIDKVGDVPTKLGSGPGLEWAKLVENKRQFLGGPLTAILGYRAEAPSWTTAAEIATQMGEKIAKGASAWKGPEWVQVWLKLNGDHEGKNTWNAVGIDREGYWWIDDPPKKMFSTAHYAIRHLPLP